MARRWVFNLRGARFLGDVRAKAVHDLDAERDGSDGCGVDAVIMAGDAFPFSSLEIAVEGGYRPCAQCVADAPPPPAAKRPAP